MAFHARDVRWELEENEEIERRGSPQAPPHVVRFILKHHCGIVGVTGRQELGTRPRSQDMVAVAPTSPKKETTISDADPYSKINNVTHKRADRSVVRSVVRSFARSFGRSVVRSFGRSFGRSVGRSVVRSVVRFMAFHARDVRWELEENEEIERRGSPQPPPHVLRFILKHHCGIVGVTGRQELGTRPRSQDMVAVAPTSPKKETTISDADPYSKINNVTRKRADRSVVRSVVRSFARSFGRSVVRSAVRSFGRSVVRSFGCSVLRSVFPSFRRPFGRSVGAIHLGHFGGHRGGVPRYARAGSEHCKTAADHSDANPYYTASSFWPLLEPSWWGASIWSIWVPTL
jgi:hypothetical protein